MPEEIYAPVIDTEMTLTDAFTQTCRVAKVNEKLKKGFRQVTKSIIRKQSKVVVLAKDYPDNMSKIIVGLAKQKNIPVIKMESSIEIGKIVGFIKKQDEEVIKTTKCGCFSLDEFVGQTEANYYIENILSNKNYE
ncbi:hypothetical protein BDAP_001229 [Binucleata daphniae]